MNYEAPTRMEISLENLKHNWNEVRKLVGPQRGIYAVLKADGYGHGAARLARLYREAGCKDFAVARVDEAIELRESGITEPILVMGQAPLDAVDAVVHYDITCACAETAYAEALNRAAAAHNKKGKIHIKIDSGMGRLGFRPDGFERHIDALFALPAVEEKSFTISLTGDDD